MPKQVAITPEVHAVLAAGRSDGNLYYLPDQQLDRPLYEATNKVLTALGGKWSRKARAHVFDRGLTDQLVDALQSGVAVDRKRTAEQFFTPTAVAAMVMERAQIAPGMSVLEPSAGDGALLRGIVTAGGQVWAYELDPILRAKLVEDFFSQFGAGGLGVDFLESVGRENFDRVVMNPPFGKGADMKHVLHALTHLKPGGKLVAIMSTHWTFAGGSVTAAFKSKLYDHSFDWDPLPEGSFRASDTMVSTGILTLRKADQ